MSVASPKMNTAQQSTNNPALNADAFAKQMEKTGEKSRAGMTVMGSYIKTLLLLFLCVLAASFGWGQVQEVTIGTQTMLAMPSWAWLLYIGVLVFGIGGVLAGRAIPIFAAGYAICFGILLGMACHFYNNEWDGIVLQAVLATISVFTATLILYMTGIIKVTGKFVMGIGIAMGALALLYLVAWLFSIFGIHFSFLFTPTPLGIGFALLVVILAALNLPIDFAFIERASAGGAPKIMEWYAAYGLMLSIVWMFVSILRLLALLRMAR